MFRTIVIGEKRPQFRNGSVPNTAWASGDLRPSSGEGQSIESYEEETSGVCRILAEPT